MVENNTQVHVTIVSPNGVVYDNDARKCHVTTVNGGLTILPRHIAMMTALEISAVVVTTLDGAEDYIAIDGGLLVNENNNINISANMALRARDIDDAQMQLVKSMAEDKIRQALIDKDIRAYQKAEVELKRATNFLKVSKHRRYSN